MHGHIPKATVRPKRSLFRRLLWRVGWIILPAVNSFDEDDDSFERASETFFFMLGWLGPTILGGLLWHNDVWSHPWRALACFALYVTIGFLYDASQSSKSQS